MKRTRPIYLIVVFAALYLPIAVLIANAFNANRYGLRWDGFTLDWFAVMFGNHALMEALKNSLLVALSSASLATAIGALGAVACYLYRFRGYRTLFGLNLGLLMLPDIILAIGLLVLFVLLGVPLGFWSLLLAHITFCLPFSLVTIYARIQGFDPYLMDAARDLGASEAQMMRRVIFPLLGPALMASWLLCFTLSLDDVIVSSFVTGPAFDVLPLRIFSMVKVGVKPEVNALATLMVAASMILVGISYTLIKEEHR